MTPVFQRIVDPERGDCYRAAIASIFDLALDGVPEDITSGFTENKWIHERGYVAIHLTEYRLIPRPNPDTLKGKPWDARNLVRFDFAHGAIALASVPSQQFPGGWHAIVVQFVLQCRDGVAPKG